MRLSVVIDELARPSPCYRHLGDEVEIEFVRADRLSGHEPREHIIVDVDLSSGSRLPAIKEYVTKKPAGGKAIFAVIHTTRIEGVRAFAAGATDLVPRPVRKEDILQKLPPPPHSLFDSAPQFDADVNPGVGHTAAAFQAMFRRAWRGGELDLDSITQAGEGLTNRVEEIGLAAWVRAVRQHHSLTFQHCLLVSGIAASFAQHLGFSSRDQQRLTNAAMIHDVGKARIPVAILEKPGALDEPETQIMRQHPGFGADMLSANKELPTETLDVVLHHHEYLDGSGYPHGLVGGEIGDLVRLMTISDIFGALLERRSYKAPLTGEAAYRILLDMGPKLDQELVRAFRPVALC